MICFGEIHETAGYAAAARNGSRYFCYVGNIAFDISGISAKVHMKICGEAGFFLFITFAVAVRRESYRILTEEQILLFLSVYLTESTPKSPILKAYCFFIA